MNKKISYILSTNRSVDVFRQSLDIILNFEKHDKEIIVCGPNYILNDKSYDYFKQHNIKYIEDKLCTGAVNGFNMAYKNTDGDYIATMIDDIGYPLNFLDILNWFDSPFMKKKKFKIVNSMWEGGPGLVTYNHDDLEDGTSYWNITDPHPVPINHCPYCVIPLATIARETIEKYLDGYIYNPLFKHHYCDSWLGFYVCKNEIYERFKWRCPSFKPYTLLNTKTVNTYDKHDWDILSLLTNNFIQGKTKYV